MGFLGPIGWLSMPVLPKKPTRHILRTILKDPSLRRELFISCGIAIQAREGIDTSYEDMAAAYDKVQKEKLTEVLKNRDFTEDEAKAYTDILSEIFELKFKDFKEKL